MTDETELQKEWRAIVINKLEALDKDIKSIQNHMSSSMVTVKELSELKLKIAEAELKIEELRRSGSQTKDGILKDIKLEYVTKEQFEPIKKIIYFVIAAGGAAILGTILKMILIKL